MSPIFKCLICKRDIERSTRTFWSKKGHLLCSTCLDNKEKNLNFLKLCKKIWIIEKYNLNKYLPVYLNESLYINAVNLIMASRTIF